MSFIITLIMIAYLSADTVADSLPKLAVCNIWTFNGWEGSISFPVSLVANVSQSARAKRNTLKSEG